MKKALKALGAICGLACVGGIVYACVKEYQKEKELEGFDFDDDEDFNDDEFMYDEDYEDDLDDTEENDLDDTEEDDLSESASDEEMCEDDSSTLAENSKSEKVLIKNADDLEKILKDVEEMAKSNKDK